MSGQDKVGGQWDRMHKEMKNKTQPFLCHDGDTNANQIPMEESYTEGGNSLPPLLSQNSTQERIIIWGTRACSEDPELDEFELLECQELEAFLKEREVKDQNTSKDGENKDLCQKKFAPSSFNPISDVTKTDQNANHSKQMEADQTTQPLDLRTSTSRSGGSRSLRETRSNSENNVFVSTFSVMSSLSGSLSSVFDTAVHTEFPSSLCIKPTSGKCSIQQSATHKSLNPAIQSKDKYKNRNQNFCSTKLPQDPEYECPKLGSENGNRPIGKQNVGTHMEYNKQENDMFSKFQRNLERVPPAYRQLVRPLFPGTEQGLTSGNLGHIDATQGQRIFHSDTGPKTSKHQTDTKESGTIISNAQSLNLGSEIHHSQISTKIGSIYRRQGSEESAASPLDGKYHLNRRAFSSPTRPSTPPSPKTTGSPQRCTSISPIRIKVPARSLQLGYSASHGYNSGMRPPVKTNINTNVPNPVTTLSATISPPKCPQKPKSVRPKIITYIRKRPQINPQATNCPYEVSSLPTRLSGSTSSLNTDAPSEELTVSPVQSASNIPYNKYRQEMQKSRVLSPELMVSGIKPPNHTIPHKATSRMNSFYNLSGNKLSSAGTIRSPTSGEKDPSENHIITQETKDFFQAPRTLRPQLGVGAVSRAPSTVAKKRIFTGQKSALAISQPVQTVSPSLTAPATILMTSTLTPSSQTPSEVLEQKNEPAAGLAAKSLLPKPAPSGLRPPGYSRLPPARLAAFGFVRSSSVSSVSSKPSTDSTQSDLCKQVHRPSSGSDDAPLHRVITASCGDGPRAPCRNSPQPPNTPVPIRRPLLPPPPGSPAGARKDFQKSSDGCHSALSSPKRLAVVSPKPQSPVLQRQRAAIVRVSGVSGGLGMPVTECSGSIGSDKQNEDAQRKAKEQDEQEIRKEEMLRLQAQCKERNGQLQALQTKLKRAVLGLDVFALCTQHFSLKSEIAEQKEEELFLALRKFQQEVGYTSTRCELLKKEKSELEQSFKLQLKELQEQQESELATLEEELRRRHVSDTGHLKAEHQSYLEELRTQQQEQIEELTALHESTLEDIRIMHNMSMASVQEEHARTMRDLRKAHEQQKTTLAEDFDKHRLSLQDQVDTLTFQNRSLRDKAKRFEEALRKSADEQILDALAPYQHIEQDLKSLKEVLEMKNQQIHDQERKISHLEKVAQKNIYLEEKVQVLQQQNEDMKARIDLNVALSRQLSEENANLQENVVKESNEKKRLSRNNDELLWLLQTSPHLSPSSSPSHRVFFPGPDIPQYPNSPSPDTPTHSYSYSPGNSTPAHRVGSPSPGTPTHRGSPATRCSPARVSNANTMPR